MSLIDDIKRDRDAGNAWITEAQLNRITATEDALIAADGLARAYVALCEMTGKDFHTHECSKLAAYRAATGAS